MDRLFCTIQRGWLLWKAGEAYFTYVDWIVSVKNYAAGVSANVPRIGTFGLSVVNHDIGPVRFENTHSRNQRVCHFRGLWGPDYRPDCGGNQPQADP